MSDTRVSPFGWDCLNGDCVASLEAQGGHDGDGQYRAGEIIKCHRCGLEHRIEKAPYLITGTRMDIKAVSR